MKTYALNALVALFALALFILAFFFFNKSDTFAGVTDMSCTVSTSSAISVGLQPGNSVIVATTSRRAWAQIQQVDAATNTVSLSFNNGAAATIATAGMQLGQGSASSTATKVSFGLNEPFAYTGAVTAITDKGSTTIRVIECNFN